MSIDKTGSDLPLSPYRVLDLTEGGFNWCGKVLGDLGADVIKIEPPGGSPTRLRGSFYKDEIHPEHSLYWYAYCVNKRGITLDIESPEDSETFKKLVATADFVIESFAPGYMSSIGLGYDDLSQINPSLIMASITPFGQTGPYAHYKATDMTAWAMGGMQYLTGDDDRPPVRVGFPQAELHAGAQAAAGSMIAFWHRQMTGEGQYVDVSMQTAVTWTLMNATAFPPLHKENAERAGAYRLPMGADSFTSKMRAVWPCKDGYVSYMFAIGRGARLSATPVVRWMAEENAAPEHIASRDWAAIELNDLAAQEDGVRIVMDLHDHIEKFFATKTKAELYEHALSDRILLAPCHTVQDIAEDPQLQARKYWVDLRHPEIDSSLTYAGPYIKLGESPIQFRRRAPLIGEHNDEVFKELLGFDARPHESDNQQDSGESSTMPFEGIKVLDFTWVAVGPLTIKYLADHGAEVVRIESVGRPDVLRHSPPFKDGEPGINRSQFPANYNTNKHGLGLNMTKPESQELVRRIIAEWQPDVISESFTPGTMRNWGLDYESVKQIKPDIIYFSTCMQGQTGPRSSYAGFGQLAAALAGYYYITGWADRGPVPPYGAYSDFINPPNALAAIVAALEYRRRTGKGQHLDLAQYECATHYLAPAIMDYIVNGRVIGRRGNADDSCAPHGVYPCKDETRSFTGAGESWCAIAVTNDDEWKAMCGAMGTLAIAADPRFATYDARKQNSEELDRLISTWTPQYEAHELMRLLQDAGVPAGAVQSCADLWDDPQLKRRDFFQWLDHTECGPMPYDGLQFILSKTPGKLRKPHALIGEHNGLVLKEFIGLTDDEIADLIVAESLETSA